MKFLHAMMTSMARAVCLLSLGVLAAKGDAHTTPMGKEVLLLAIALTAGIGWMERPRKD
ncbi:MAG TPA: hypothetical protein VK797_23050 [Tepidisphaeraceae bacterium]|jgi:hypothetical protein|nr:hypothetical protein [Tepidisphaeraceae bacterium]